uniref:Secreted protein n=1 Tax=Anopheles darlingi TaxID=43151 RepID=A0A2M4DAA4_ANODA
MCAVSAVCRVCVCVCFAVCCPMVAIWNPVTLLHPPHSRQCPRPALTTFWGAHNPFFFSICFRFLFFPNKTFQHPVCVCVSVSE